jgi:hypothetical protein
MFYHDEFDIGVLFQPTGNYRGPSVPAAITNGKS